MLTVARVEPLVDGLLTDGPPLIPQTTGNFVRRTGDFETFDDQGPQLRVVFNFHALVFTPATFDADFKLGGGGAVVAGLEPMLLNFPTDGARINGQHSSHRLLIVAGPSQRFNSIPVALFQVVKRSAFFDCFDHITSLYGKLHFKGEFMKDARKEVGYMESISQITSRMGVLRAQIAALDDKELGQWRRDSLLRLEKQLMAAISRGKLSAELADELVAKSQRCEERRLDAGRQFDLTPAAKALALLGEERNFVLEALLKLSGRRQEFITALKSAEGLAKAEVIEAEIWPHNKATLEAMITIRKWCVDQLLENTKDA